VFTLHALDEPSGLTSGFSPDDLRDALRGKVVATGTLTGTYAR
jgi:phosphatidylethanolamine-binding protein (PEBP) family uncharacterized protein